MARKTVPLTEFLSIPDFLALVPIGRTHLHKMMNEGKIASVAIGARRLIPATEIERLTKEARDSLGRGKNPIASSVHTRTKESSDGGTKSV